MEAAHASAGPQLRNVIIPYRVVPGNSPPHLPYQGMKCITQTAIKEPTTI